MLQAEQKLARIFWLLLA